MLSLSAFGVTGVTSSGDKVMIRDSHLVWMALTGGGSCAFV